MKKNVKITKGEHVFIGYVNSYNTEILNLLNFNCKSKILKSQLKIN